jgi:sugar-specific transcriptional regulator TrmB
MAADDTIQALVDLGFTGLEAEVYTALLAESPTTGYRVAQALGKAVANTYKAIASLEAKGAVLVDEGESRVCRPVPPDELLARLGRSFTERRERAAGALARFREAPADDRVYQMRSREQVMERARQMLERAERIALLDVFPGPLEALRPDLERAAARGIDVAMKVYAPAEVAGAETIVSARGAEVLGRWPGEWVNLVVDGAEHLLAFLAPDGDEVYQAVWSGSAYLSWVYQSAVSGELILARLEDRIGRGAGAARLREELSRLERFRGLDAPGYLALLRRFGAESGPRKASSK